MSRLKVSGDVLIEGIDFNTYTDLVHGGVQLHRALYDVPSLCEVGLKLVVSCLQLGDLSLNGVSRKVIPSRHLVSHATQLGQVVELVLQGTRTEREN